LLAQGLRNYIGAMALRENFRLSLSFLGIFLFVAASPPGVAAPTGDSALVRYLQQPDAGFAWEAGEPEPGGVRRLKLTSQKWRESLWRHDILVVMPAALKHLDAALVLVTGSKKLDGYIPYLRLLADRAGAPAAVVNNVPNQPLYDGRKEDALIAYTFNEYLKTGDETWPLVFPMVKSAVRALDALSEFSVREGGEPLTRFVLTGASKRGWTTWLTAPVDRRVVGIAPMVFDILNMHVQTDWAKQVWGRQSEQISDYTELGLVGREDDERREKLYGWIDPYVNRRRYTMPKLLLLGTNDRYWAVDSTRHYYRDLAEPKAIHQTPNLGHDIGRSRSMPFTLAAFARAVLEGEQLPRLTTRITGGRVQTAEIEVRSSVPVKAMKVWTANSDDRDFRDAKWTSDVLRPGVGRTLGKYRVPLRQRGYRAVMFEATYVDDEGKSFRLSTEVSVVPDLLAGEAVAAVNARPPADSLELRQWMENLVGHHGFAVADVTAATGLGTREAKAALKRFGIKPFGAKHAGKGLKVLPFPGGWHPRIGFLDGAVNLQRDTKLSVFTPWDPRSFVVVDVPEAIWSNLGLTYLAHTHVSTIWSEKGIELEKLEWKETESGFEIERRLPNGIRFGCVARPGESELTMRLWLHNGTKAKLTGMRVQNCVMLKGAHEFSAQTRDNKILRSPFAACRNEAGDRWVITAWEPIHRPWGNSLCPCLHSDPKFPDAEPGETVEVKGWLSFYEGPEIQAELQRLATRWKIEEFAAAE
jgi:PhoPQ-activated pathogenicity-related protein